VSRNYLTCPRCRWTVLTSAIGRFTDHIEYAHPRTAERIGAAAVPAASHWRASMPHFDTHKHDHAIAIGLNGPHPHPAGHPQHITEIAKRLAEEVKAAGYDLAHAGILTDGEHIELHHAPTGERPIDES
jgi:hypothetical protein